MADLAQAIEEGHIAAHRDGDMYVISHRALRRWIGRDETPRVIYHTRKHPTRQRPAS